MWNYDGSSTGQAPGEDSEVYLVARAIFKDPFRKGDNILVLCDAYEPPRILPDGTVSGIKAIPTNTRAACAEVGACTRSCRRCTCSAYTQLPWVSLGLCAPACILPKAEARSCHFALLSTCMFVCLPAQDCQLGRYAKCMVWPYTHMSRAGRDLWFCCWCR
jgi:hypothetical protein